MVPCFGPPLQGWATALGSMQAAFQTAVARDRQVWDGSRLGVWSLEMEYTPPLRGLPYYNAVVCDRWSILLAGAVIATGCSTTSKQIVAEAKPEPKGEGRPAVASLAPGELAGETVQRVKGATVFITNLEGGQPTAMGSGFRAVNKRWIVTARHVVTGTDDDVDPCKVTVGVGTSDERTFRVLPEKIHVVAGITRESEQYGTRDVAILELPGELKGDPLEVGVSEKLQETQTVWACGFPDGELVRKADKGSLPSPSVHVLRVERLDRKAGEVLVLQLSGSPTHGDSGGAVVTSDGRVVGVMQALERTDATILYAVPTAPLEDLVAAAQSGKTMLAKSEPEAPPAAKPRPRRTVADYRADKNGFYEVMSTHVLTEDELSGFTAKELTILRNAPYATHGYIFQRAELRTAFSGADWYRPRTSDARAVFNAMTATERANVETIKALQEANGLTW